jgi:hypothetical protein
MTKLETYPLTDKVLSLVGKYWIGDPCYVFSDNDWSKLCDLIFPDGDATFDDSNNVRVVKVDDDYAFLFGTFSGDGVYPARIDNVKIGSLGVDAGMLSVIPVKLLKKYNWGESKRHGIIVDFDGSSNKMSVSDGDFVYGKLVINTSDD